MDVVSPGAFGLFPAPAGMNRVRSALSLTKKAVPRTRGDELGVMGIGFWQPDLAHAHAEVDEAELLVRFRTSYVGPPVPEKSKHQKKWIRQMNESLRRDRLQVRPLSGSPER